MRHTVKNSQISYQTFVNLCFCFSKLPDFELNFIKSLYFNFSVKILLRTKKILCLVFASIFSSNSIHGCVVFPTQFTLKYPWLVRHIISLFNISHFRVRSGIRTNVGRYITYFINQCVTVVEKTL